MSISVNYKNIQTIHPEITKPEFRENFKEREFREAFLADLAKSETYTGEFLARYRAWLDGFDAKVIEKSVKTEVPKKARPSYIKTAIFALGFICGGIVGKTNFEFPGSNALPTQGDCSFGYENLTPSNTSFLSPDILQKIDEGMDVNKPSAFTGNTPLGCAMLSPCDPDVVTGLFKRGANPNLADGMGITPLMYAMTSSSEECATLLLDNPETNITLRDTDQLTALHYACKNGMLDMARRLIAKGADVKAIDLEAVFPYSLKVLDEDQAQNQREILKLLIENGAEANRIAEREDIQNLMEEIEHQNFISSLVNKVMGVFLAIIVGAVGFCFAKKKKASAALQVVKVVKKKKKAKSKKMPREIDASIEPRVEKGKGKIDVVQIPAN